MHMQMYHYSSEKSLGESAFQKGLCSRQLEQGSAQGTAARVRAVEPLEQAARVEPVLARPTRLGGQGAIGEGDDAAQISHPSWSRKWLRGTYE